MTLGDPDLPTLDPEDWDAYARSWHAQVDALIAHLRVRSAGPVWRPVPDALKRWASAPAPLEGVGIDAALREVRERLLPFATGNAHPRFFGWVHGSGTVGGAIAEMTAAALNANVGGRDHGAVYLERQVVGWFRDLFGLPQAAGGLLLSGTSMGNLVALALARNRGSGHDVRDEGVGQGPRAMVYASTQAHDSVRKAVEFLGLGRRSLGSVAVDGDFRLDTSALGRRIEADRTAGLRPIAVVATAGSVNTGAIDDLAAVADLCSRHGLWFHVDGAFGALIALVPDLRSRLTAIERADSIAFDFHKWLHVPYDAGCLLVRDGSALAESFATVAAYLGTGDALAGGAPWFADLGPELSRGFRALKVWITIKEHGLARLGAKIAENCAQARHLADRIAATPGLELLAPVGLNIVCFRACPPGKDAADLDRLNLHIVATLQERGLAAPSTTRVGEATAIRVNLTNHRTRRADLDALVVDILAIAAER
ncbi:MAG: cytochrome D ubiquinol oxidase subunit I [Alphaproteobacteria bacterium]|nr:cytochrome D ubiquinol oxidase subunit I [Alphaproteobacteria bacterium]